MLVLVLCAVEISAVGWARNRKSNTPAPKATTEVDGKTLPDCGGIYLEKEDQLEKAKRAAERKPGNVQAYATTYREDGTSGGFSLRKPNYMGFLAVRFCAKFELAVLLKVVKEPKNGEPITVLPSDVDWPEWKMRFIEVCRESDFGVPRVPPAEKPK